MKRRVQMTVAVLLALTLTGCSGKADKFYSEGIKNLESGSYAQAVEAFQKGLETDQRLAENYRGLGIA